MKNKCDILHLEWASSGRDIDITEPVLSYLEVKYKLKIVRKSIWGGIFKLFKYKPELLLISNDTGAPENFLLLKAAYKLGIKCVTLVSEGDYIEEKTESFFWGWNKDKILYKDLMLVWSERTQKYIKKHIDNIDKSKIKTSGATGFDRYKILTYMNKQEFLIKYKKTQYDKVILVSGWGFDRYSAEFIESFKKGAFTLTDDYLKNQTFFLNSCKEINKILHEVIKNNKDILFILKYHPGVVLKNKTEFTGLNQYENILELKREENISDLINASDFLCAFESTTCLEAWLLDKQTFLINPCGTNFKRSSIAAGSPITKNINEVQNSINKYYKHKKINGFDDYLKNREKIIKDVIGFSDGRNHIRAGEEIIKLLNSKIKRKKHINFFIIQSLLSEIILRICLLPIINKFGKFKRLFNNYNNKVKNFTLKERENEMEKYKKGLNKFYEKNNISL